MRLSKFFVTVGSALLVTINAKEPHLEADDAEAFAAVAKEDGRFSTRPPSDAVIWAQTEAPHPTDKSAITLTTTIYAYRIGGVWFCRQ